jgi:hypothetical protein
MGTIQIHEVTATDTGVDKTSGTVRFKSADETTVDASNRLQIPGAGSDFSYTKQLRAYVSVAPDTDFTNLLAYSDGANGFGTGVTVEYDVEETFASNTDADISGADLFSKTSGAAIDMDSNDTQWTDGDSTGYWGDNLRLQMHVTNTASPGSLSTETLTFSYDET